MLENMPRPARRALGVVLLLLGLALIATPVLRFVAPGWFAQIPWHWRTDAIWIIVVCIFVGGALVKIGWDYVRHGEQRMDLDP